jgi:hypothetical protein
MVRAQVEKKWQEKREAKRLGKTPGKVYSFHLYRMYQCITLVLKSYMLVANDLF